MLAPTFYNENPFQSSFFPTFSSSPTSSNTTLNNHTYPSHSAPIPIKVPRRTPKVDVGPGPARDEDDASSPTSPLSSTSSFSDSTTPSTPPSSIFSKRNEDFPPTPPRRASTIRLPPSSSPSTTLSLSAPTLTTQCSSTSTTCKKVRFDRSLTILPYTSDPLESHPIIGSPPKSIWTKISEAVGALRVGTSPSSTTTTSPPQLFSSSWPGTTTSTVPPSIPPSTADAEPTTTVEEGSITGFEAWKEAKEKCGWEIKVVDGGYDGACRLQQAIS